MTEQQFNNAKTLLESRNRIAGIKTLLQGESSIAIIEELNIPDTKIYFQVKAFAIELLAEEEARLQQSFDALEG